MFFLVFTIGSTAKHYSDLQGFSARTGDLVNIHNSTCVGALWTLNLPPTQGAPLLLFSSNGVRSGKSSKLGNCICCPGTQNIFEAEDVETSSHSEFEELISTYLRQSTAIFKGLCPVLKIFIPFLTNLSSTFDGWNWFAAAKIGLQFLKICVLMEFNFTSFLNSMLATDYSHETKPGTTERLTGRKCSCS